MRKMLEIQAFLEYSMVVINGHSFAYLFCVITTCYALKLYDGFICFGGLMTWAGFYIVS